MRIFIRQVYLNPMCPKSGLDKLIDVTDKPYPTIRVQNIPTLIIAETRSDAREFVRNERRCAD